MRDNMYFELFSPTLWDILQQRMWGPCEVGYSFCLQAIIVLQIHFRLILKERRWFDFDPQSLQTKLYPVWDAEAQMVAGGWSICLSVCVV